jgi:hypothetical protein
MPKTYKTTGALIGNTPYDLTNDSPSNRVGGLLPGTAQPTGTKFISYGESGTSTAFNRAFNGLSAQSDLQQMVNSFYNAIPCTFDHTLIPGLDLSAGADATIDIQTLAGGIGPMYAQVGPFLDQVMGNPFCISHGATHPNRAGARVRQQLANVIYQGAAYYDAAFAVKTAAATYPVEIAPLCAISARSPGIGSTCFDRDGIVPGVTLSSLYVYPGAFVEISGPINPGWYQVIDVVDSDRKAILMNTAAKRIPVDTWVPSPWIVTPYGGHLFTTPGGQGFYVYDYDDTNGYLYVHPWTGAPRTVGAVNDVHTLADGDVLTNAASLESCAVDLSGGRTIQDVGAPLVFDTTVAVGATRFDFYAPPGFVPIGTPAPNTVLIDYGAFPLDGGVATDLYTLNIGIHAGTESINRSFFEAGFALHPTPQTEVLNARANLGEISQPGANNDRKVRVTAHDADTAIIPQVSVFTNAGALVHWVNSEGWIYNDTAGASEAVAPFDAYKSRSVSVQRNIIGGQAITEAEHTGRLLNDPVWTTPGASQLVNATADFYIATAGEIVEIAAASPLLTGPPWNAGTTYFIYYDVATGTVLATDTPAAILFSDFPDPAAAQAYPVGGDVLLGWFTTGGGGVVLEVHPTAKFAKGEVKLPLTVGSGLDSNFTNISEAIAFVTQQATFVTAGGSATEDFNFQATIRLTSDITVTAATGITALDTLVIDGDGHTLIWAPAAVTDVFNVDGDATYLEVKNLVVDHDDSTAAGHAFLQANPATAHCTVNKLVFKNITYTATSGYPAHFLQIDSGGNNISMELLEIKDVNWESTAHSINIDGVTAGNVNLGAWDIDNFRFYARANAVTQAAINIRLDNALAATYSKALRKIQNCHLHCESTVAGDAFGYGVYIAGAHADHAKILSTHIYDAAASPIYSDAPYFLVGQGCYIDNSACTVVPAGPAISINEVDASVRSTQIVDYDGVNYVSFAAAASRGVIGPEVNVTAATKTPTGPGFLVGSDKSTVKECTFTSSMVNDGAVAAFGVDGGMCFDVMVTGWNLTAAAVPVFSFSGSDATDPMHFRGNTLAAGVASPAGIMCLGSTQEVILESNTFALTGGVCLLCAATFHQQNWAVSNNIWLSTIETCVDLGESFAFSSFTGNNIRSTTAPAPATLHLITGTTAAAPDLLVGLAFSGNFFEGPQLLATPTYHIGLAVGAGGTVNGIVAMSNVFSTTATGVGVGGCGVLIAGAVSLPVIFAPAAGNNNIDL